MSRKKPKQVAKLVKDQIQRDNKGPTPTIRGLGTPENPGITWSPHCHKRALRELSQRRRQANEFIAWSVAKALSYPHAVIQMWNHSTQNTYDDHAQKITVWDAGLGRRVAAQIAADSHMTVELGGNRVPGLLGYTAHIYTVDDAAGVPLRVRLNSERVIVSEIDAESPQMFVNGRNLREYCRMAGQAVPMQIAYGRSVTLFPAMVR